MMNDTGTCMLQDGVMAREDWLADAKNQETRSSSCAPRSKAGCSAAITSTMRRHLLRNGSALGKSHMQWRLNKVNVLIWPSPGSIGQMNKKAYSQTVDIATTYGVFKAKPDARSYRTNLAKKALEGLDGDENSGSFAKKTVTLVEGGKLTPTTCAHCNARLVDSSRALLFFRSAEKDGPPAYERGWLSLQRRLTRTNHYGDFRRLSANPTIPTPTIPKSTLPIA